jgi:hypothetical protein
MDEKKINIDMNLFKITGKTKKKRDDENKEKKIKVKNSIEKSKNDTLKKKSILKMIRQHQEERYKKLFEKDEKKNIEEDDNFNKDFKEAKDYLQSLTEKNENSFNKTLKNHSMNSKSLLLNSFVEPFKNDIANVSNNVINDVVIPNSNMILQPSLQNLPIPKYGCLKNGVLPTYRTYMNQTRKSSPIMNNSVFDMKINGGSRESLSHKEPISKPIIEPINVNQNIIEDKINNSLKRANEIQNTIKKMNQLKQNNRPKKIKRKRIIRRTFKIGKSKINPKIGVLVSNKTLRTNISTKSQLLKQTSIEEVKKFLIKRGMIKVGSITPNDVLRKMYESSSMMCGEIYNHNPENLLYNYFNEK